MVLREMVPEHGLLTEMEATELYELGVWDMIVRAYTQSPWEMRLELRAQGQHRLCKSPRSKQPTKQLHKQTNS